MIPFWVQVACHQGETTIEQAKAVLQALKDEWNPDRALPSDKMAKAFHNLSRFKRRIERETGRTLS